MDGLVSCETTSPQHPHQSGASELVTRDGTSDANWMRLLTGGNVMTIPRERNFVVKLGQQGWAGLSGKVLNAQVV